ncbi:hypothetical protein [Streptomyces umbrinus]|uniref:hypothetical protein n=1 Tax=Streptomyces umbrinus TaxID=67370 RepID=UPI0033D80451
MREPAPHSVAVLDVAQLGRAIADHPGDTESALTTYEQELFPRSEESAADFAAGLELMFGDNALQGVYDQFASHSQADN